MGAPCYPRVWLGGGQEEEGLAGAPSRGWASLRPSVPLLFSARGAGPRPAAVRKRGRGAGRAAGSGSAPALAPPPAVRAAPSGHCRISIEPRHNFTETQRDPGARAGGNIVPAGGARGGGGGGGGGAGARRPARGSRRRGGHAPGGSGSPGTRRNLPPGILKSWGGRGLRAGAPGRLSSPSLTALPFGRGGGGSCPPSREARSAPARSRPRGAVQLIGSWGQSERKVLPKLPGWSCRAGRRRSPWNSRATR